MTVVTSRPRSVHSFHFVAALQILVATAALLSALLRHSCYSAEAFSSLGAPNARTRKMAPTGNEEDAKKAQQKDRKRGEPTTSSAPMYITIGPQCCGKSSFLREFEGLKIKDICLDDQSDVYVPVSTQTFLRAYDDENHDAAKVDEEAQSVLQQVYQGKTLLERIRENIELILILRRWNGDSSAEDFGRRIRSFYKERNFTEDVAKALIRAVEEFLSSQPQLPQETDVFVLESLFKPHPEIGQSAIQKAHEDLRKTPKHIPVAWGNTNAKPRDYEQALEICHQTRRPVRFVLCHPGHGSRKVNDSGNNEPELLTLPWVSFDELLKRNLYRLQAHGRFIPANAIADCQERVTAMVPRNLFDDAGYSKNIEDHLVSIASPGYGRNDNRRFKPSFRYSLTTYRLVQKQYPPNAQGYSSHQRRNNRNHGGNRYNGERGPRPTKKPKSEYNGNREPRPYMSDRQRNDSNGYNRNRHNDQDRETGTNNRQQGRRYPDRDRDDPRSRSRRRDDEHKPNR